VIKWKRVERVVESPVRMAVLLAALGTALLFAAGASGRVAVQVYTDPAGDAGVGPDIRSLSISDSGGILTFKLVATGMTVTTGSGVTATAAYADLDTNKDGKRDYVLWVGNDADGFVWDLEGPGGKHVQQSSGSGYFRSGDSYTFKVASSDLGGATSFDVWVVAGTVDGTGAGARTDDAPDGGEWSYSLTSVKPVIGTPTTSPVSPIAGKAFTITLPVTRSDSGVKLAIGTMTSDLRVGTQTLVHTQSFKNGTAAVHLTVPTSAKGRVMTVRIAIQSGGQSVTRVTSFRVA
jgi:hypothetical protein